MLLKVRHGDSAYNFYLFITCLFLSYKTCSLCKRWGRATKVQVRIKYRVRLICIHNACYIQYKVCVCVVCKFTMSVHKGGHYTLYLSLSDSREYTRSRARVHF